MNDTPYDSEFDLSRASALIGLEVAKYPREISASRRIEDEFIGEVVGLVTLNDEIEILIKFSSGLEQVTRELFEEHYQVLHAPY